MKKVIYPKVFNHWIWTPIFIVKKVMVKDGKNYNIRFFSKKEKKVYYPEILKINFYPIILIETRSKFIKQD